MVLQWQNYVGMAPAIYPTSSHQAITISLHFQTSSKDTLRAVSLSCHLASIHQRALILFIQTVALYKSFTYLLIWDHIHTVFSASGHKSTRPALTPARRLVSPFAYHGGMEGWVDLEKPEVGPTSGSLAMFRYSTQTNLGTAQTLRHACQSLTKSTCFENSLSSTQQVSACPYHGPLNQVQDS